MPNIRKIEPEFPVFKQKKRVAAYARISMSTEKLEHSLEAQISYYNRMIQKNPDWLFAGIYADDGISGTGTSKRAEFNQMIKDCEAGMIDIILTKSISRFARNTVDLLKTVRKLKKIGVEVWFERENIHSMDGDGELMLSILASFAQEESRSISDNRKWSIRKRFEQGIPSCHYRVYGYRWEGDEMVPVPEEAEVVKMIFRTFLDNKTVGEIKACLDKDGKTTMTGRRWAKERIKDVLTNIVYCGDLMLQKLYTNDPIDRKQRKNRGELPRYLIRDHHEAIIDRETFDFVQSELIRRRCQRPASSWKVAANCFTGMIRCEKCGADMTRSVRTNKAALTSIGDKRISWECYTRRKGGQCSTKEILERYIEIAAADALGISEFDEEVFLQKVDHISVPDNGRLVFHFIDGTVRTEVLKKTSYKDCWTDEAKARASAYFREHPPVNKEGVTCFTTKIKCGSCGANYSSQKWHGIRYFRCSKYCGSRGLREDLLKSFLCEVLGMSEFDDRVFLEKVDRIIVYHPNKLLIVKTDGSSEERIWDFPKCTPTGKTNKGK